MTPANSGSNFSIDVPLKLDPGSGELGHKNVDENTLRKIISTVEFRDCTATATMRGVFYGLYNKQSAALVLFRFVFHGPLKRNWRYTTAKVTATFATKVKDPDSNINQDNPYILTIFPYTVFGDVSEEKRHWNMEIAGSLKASCGVIAEGGVDGKMGKDGSYVRGNRMQIQGFCGPSSSTQDKEDLGRWDIAENSLQKTGIPHDFCCGVIVGCPGDRFEAIVDLSFSLALTGSWKFGAWPWNLDHPLVFAKKDSLEALNQTYLEEVRAILGGRDFKDLTEDDFQKLTPLPKEYHVRHRSSYNG